MSTAIYRAKRALRSPLIWHGRRKYANAGESERRLMEHHDYRQSAKTSMSIISIDPYYFHRADLDASSVVIDVGAFRGDVAQEFVELYGCEVHAYEPHPAFFVDLEKRYADNPLVHAYAYGLGDRDATLVMQQMGLGSTVYGKDDGSVPTVNVEIQDIADVLDRLGLDRVDYIKINIEGAEYDLIDRLIDSGWINRSRYLLIQFHEWYDDANIRRWKIRRKLRQTHAMVWDHPWVYELWCAKDQPHPLEHKWSKADTAAITAAIRAERAAKDAAGS